MEDPVFSRLHAELIIKVYEYALTFDRVSCRPHEPSRFWPERSLGTCLALTRVCKQIRAEYQHLPFTPERAHCRGSTGLTTGPLIITRQLRADWIAIKLFFGRILRNTQAHGSILLDVTPGDEKIGLHLWCEAGDHEPSETGLESRYELRPAIVTAGSNPGRSIVAANFDCEPVRATVACHRDHDRALCNVAKHGGVTCSSGPSRLPRWGDHRPEYACGTLPIRCALLSA